MSRSYKKHPAGGITTAKSEPDIDPPMTEEAMMQASEDPDNQPEAPNKLHKPSRHPKSLWQVKIEALPFFEGVRSACLSASMMAAPTPFVPPPARPDPTEHEVQQALHVLLADATTVHNIVQHIILHPGESEIQALADRMVTLTSTLLQSRLPKVPVYQQPPEPEKPPRPMRGVIRVTKTR